MRPRCSVEHTVFDAGFDQRGRLVEELLPIAHKGEKSMLTVMSPATASRAPS
jgi:hypothetical protein